jgi:50S ribosomal protein L16 3-hydroxylase
MYTVNLDNLTPKQFLEQYWQKKPLLIRQGISDFDDPISPDELAGLALDEQVESRLVWQQDGKWQAAHGPFDDYEHLGEKNWSLLIQGTDHFDRDVAELIRPFRFIPNWRIDDVMVSFATPGGGVGPHVDNYDVFIIQGSGKRHWRVGSNEQLSEVVAHQALLHVEAFEPIIDVELLPGDILYIPPGFPHQGVAVEPSMSFSVGFRTTAKSHLLSALADHVIDNQLNTDMVTDPDRQVTTTPGLLDPADFSNLKSSLIEIIDDDIKLTEFFGRHLSQAKHELDIEQVEKPYQAIDILTALQNNHQLVRIGGVRCIYFDNPIAKGSIYINGEEFILPITLAPAIELFADHSELSFEQLAPWLEHENLLTFICQLLNAGYWYIEE